MQTVRTAQPRRELTLLNAQQDGEAAPAQQPGLARKSSYPERYLAALQAASETVAAWLASGSSSEVGRTHPSDPSVVQQPPMLGLHATSGLAACPCLQCAPAGTACCYLLACGPAGSESAVAGAQVPTPVAAAVKRLDALSHDPIFQGLRKPEVRTFPNLAHMAALISANGQLPA